MASTGTGGSLPPNFLLTPQQQSLLFAALNSNKQSNTINNPPTASPAVFNSAAAPGNGQANSFNDSPFLDNLDTLDYNDFGDSSFDFSFANGDQSIVGDTSVATIKSESPENGDAHEKRSHPDDEEGTPVESDAKRRESTDKVPKKPGRKPLTSEPSSKRKAQNRAAQRAFRERKEQHLKDLETKVEELQKASEDANNENSVLRAKVEQMTSELNQYKKKIALMSQSSPQPRDKFSSFGANPLSGFNDLDFQFDFPTFGVPTPPTDKSQRSVSQPISPHQSNLGSATASKNGSVKSPSQDAAFNAQFNEELAKFNNGFTPSMSSSVTNASRASLDSASFSIGGATSSPSASSQSNAGPSSSCGTSPEPATQSPMGFKPVETLTTIGEEPPAMSTSAQPFTQFSNMTFDTTNFDWLAQQNGGQFDPQLFGDYREPQNNVLSNPSFDDFFNDPAENDFFTPFNMPPVPAVGSKKNICDEIDAQKDTVHEEPVKIDKANMSCNQIWEKLQSCPNAQNGEFDLDALCSDLTKKAKCSGNGPVVGEADFNTILKKYMGNKDASCVASKLGIEVEKAT
ncbi:hypothetical protein NLU13_9534 [Sarocladium strictum]|uniref:BZIP domain-containing protein n=1 Tax=Sarocladium strictum TaxID=5046 RepID=A0AA39GBE4_SARSR|nr:hypothetical protein NLU13_9534 [Sarocladium strictum]